MSIFTLLLRGFLWVEILLLALLLAPYVRHRLRSGEMAASYRVMSWSIALATLLLALSTLPAWLLLPLGSATLLISLILLASACLLVRKSTHIGIDSQPVRRFDERDNVFCRNALKPGSDNFLDYYARHPERLMTDDAFRALPGLFGRRANFYQPYHFAAGRAMLDTIYRGIYHHLDGEVATEKQSPDPRSITNYLKALAARLGAHSSGVTLIRDYHVFTHAGYGKRYGEPIEMTHSVAFVITVEMDRDITATAPRGSVWLEIGKHYLGAAVISSVIAATIRQLGYSAKAHVLERDQVIMPLVARDAGLGEIGRIGVLMTPAAGPRVRLGVVTTDLALVEDRRVPDFGTMSFCETCNKCAEACPADAIPLGPSGDEDGVARWQVNHEACFTYWNKTGAPCGRCLAVCPLSGTDHGLDWFIKRTARGSAPAQKIALIAHDYLYGKKPRPMQVPEWANVIDRNND